MISSREKTISSWFNMWLGGVDTGIDKIFTPDCIYIESWGPKYNGVKSVKHWFNEWNKRGKVIVWDIKQFFHNDNQTAVEWYFKDKMNDGRQENFNGVSVISWSENGQISYLKEFGSKLPHYNPYEYDDLPNLKNREMWM